MSYYDYEEYGKANQVKLGGSIFEPFIVTHDFLSYRVP